MKTRQKIDKAIESLWFKIGKITQKTISKESGLGLRTVQRYIGREELQLISEIRSKMKMEKN